MKSLMSWMILVVWTGTTLEVPDPEDWMENGDRRYQIQLVSRNGPIDIYLVNAPPTDQVSTGYSVVVVVVVVVDFVVLSCVEADWLPIIHNRRMRRSVSLTVITMRMPLLSSVRRMVVTAVMMASHPIPVSCSHSSNSSSRLPQCTSFHLRE